MKILAALLVGLLCWASALLAKESASGELRFPALTGAVVDEADMLGGQGRQRLTQMLTAHQQATGEQLVVVTLTNLQGRSIEEFGVELGRHWGIGQRGEDNGVLLIVARDERRIRIEVGYGLEGQLTDAQSALIINSIITPAFQRGQFERGIVDGASAIIQVLGGNPLQAPTPRSQSEQASEQPLTGLFILLFMIVIFLIGGGGGKGGRGRRRNALLTGALLGGMGRHPSMGGGLGGGFGGGGGSFGGGGASGGW